MKKVIISILLVAVSATMMAQDGACAVGLQLGFSQKILRANAPINDPAQQETLQKLNLNGLKVGVVFEGNIIRGFGALFTLNYSYGGGTTKWQRDSEISLYPQIRSRYNLHSLELTCDWQYKFKIAKDTYFILYTGPGIQCNLSLHEQTFTQKDPGGPIDESVKDQLIRKVDKADDYKAYSRVNVTWGVGGGFQYDRYFIRGGYDFGLMNPYSYKNFDQVLHPQTQQPLYSAQATHGRQDQWFIKLGIFLWQSDNY